MACREEHAGTAAYRFCPDVLQNAAQRLRAIVGARLVDEITGQPVSAPHVSTPDAQLALHTVARVSSGGVVGLAGHPAQLFPKLALVAAQVPLAVEAAGYLPRQLDGTLGPITTGFPDSFAPLDHGDIALHRVGVALTGRVVLRASPANTPLGAAAVTIDGIWPTFPPPNVSLSAVMAPPRMVSLAPGLYDDHASATLARCDVVPHPAQTKHLLLPAAPGERRLRLHNRQTLALGMPLLVDAADASRAEVIGIANIDVDASDDQAAWIALDYPLKQLHRAGAQIVPASVPLTHDPRSLSRAALIGDAIAFLTMDAPWASGSLVRIDDGGKPPEYQHIDRYAAIADPTAYFRLPRLSRLALVRLRATHASQPQPLLMIVEPDYRLAEQNLLVAFK